LRRIAETILRSIHLRASFRSSFSLVLLSILSSVSFAIDRLRSADILEEFCRSGSFSSSVLLSESRRADRLSFHPFQSAEFPSTPLKSQQPTNPHQLGFVPFANVTLLRLVLPSPETLLTSRNNPSPLPSTPPPPTKLPRSTTISSTRPSTTWLPAPTETVSSSKPRTASVLIIRRGRRKIQRSSWGASSSTLTKLLRLIRQLLHQERL